MTANIFDLPSVKEEEIFVDTIKQLNPDVVGISLNSPYVLIAKRLTELIKKYTSAIVVWGGVGPTISPGDHIKLTDIICIGEGERALEELVIAVRDGKDYKNIKNLWVNDGAKVIKNTQGPLIQDLDYLPFAEYGNENMYFVERDELSKVDPELDHSTLYIQSTRGCPYSCSFCVETMYHDIYKGLGKFVRRRSVGNIIKEINLHQNRHGNRKNWVYFIDEVLALPQSLWTNLFPDIKKKWVYHLMLYHPKL
jgi:radical SAM superfamily enzyme YgiQ (UPF0313 family)